MMMMAFSGIRSEVAILVCTSGLRVNDCSILGDVSVYRVQPKGDVYLFSTWSTTTVYSVCVLCASAAEATVSTGTESTTVTWWYRDWLDYADFCHGQAPT